MTCLPRTVAQRCQRRHRRDSPVGREEPDSRAGYLRGPARIAGFRAATAPRCSASSTPRTTTSFEVHQYLDKDSSGSHPEVVSATVGVERLRAFTDWCRTNQRQEGVSGRIWRRLRPHQPHRRRQHTRFYLEVQCRRLDGLYLVGGRPLVGRLHVQHSNPKTGTSAPN